MKFLFIVQGEGRGHLTQAITLEEMLLRNGHEVVEVLVGESSSRILPGFLTGIYKHRSNVLSALISCLRQIINGRI